MKRLGVFLGVVVGLSALTGCAGSDEATGSDEGALTAKFGAPLDEKDFAKELSKPFIQGTHTLSPSDFEVKWKASRSESPLMFFRAYPAAYHKDFAVNLRSTEKIPGAQGLCLGDAHPDNFGFLKFDSKVIYAFNDLDDSGNCRVALDALRYVTAVRLYFDKDLAETAAKRYVKVLKGEVSETDARGDIAKLRDDFAPDFAERRADKLDELIKKDALRLDDATEAIPETTRTTIFDTVTKALPGVVTLDAVFVKRDAGGSGGLARYWVLVRRGSSRSLLELKEAAKPGVDHGLDAKPLNPDTRLATLKKAIWGVTTDKDYVYVKTLGKTFLVRDRLAKASIDLSKLKKKELEEVIEAQASLIALLHKSTLTVGNDDDAKAIRTWLVDGSDVLASRWKGAFK